MLCAASLARRADAQRCCAPKYPKIWRIPRFFRLVDALCRPEIMRGHRGTSPAGSLSEIRRAVLGSATMAHPPSVTVVRGPPARPLSAVAPRWWSLPSLVLLLTETARHGISLVPRENAEEKVRRIYFVYCRSIARESYDIPYPTPTSILKLWDGYGFVIHRSKLPGSCPFALVAIGRESRINLYFSQ